MAEVDISPLAKRLAEENNVDWRVLNGSGESGRIVERDVLDYLARVMAGDEAADPTPEPLPNGLQSWPDQPAADRGNAGWNSREESTPAAAAGDDDLLEVEGADATPAASADWSQGEWGADDWGAAGGASKDADDDFFGGMSDLGGEPSTGGGESGFDFGSADEDQSFELGNQSEQRDLGVSEGSAEFDLGSDSAGDDRSVFDTGSMEPAIDEGIFVFDDEEPAPSEASDVGGSFDFSDSGLAASANNDAALDAANDETIAPAGDSFDFGAAQEQLDTAGSDTEHTPWEGTGSTADEVEEEVAAADGAGDGPWQPAEPSATDLPSSDAPWTAVSAEPGASDQIGAPSGREYDFLDKAEEALPDGVRIEENEHRVMRSGSYGVSAAAATAEAIEAAPTPARAAGPRGVVSSGIVLRREVDVTALVDASKALSVELDGQPSLAAFVLRAAARTGTPWPLTGAADEVGLAKLSDDGISVSVVPGASTMPFRDLIGASVGEGAEGGEVALAVADVSQLGIDEAVLDLGSPVLTIGRVLESDRGRQQATLTLSGLNAPESGSKFLGRVAELLAAPVRLVV